MEQMAVVDETFAPPGAAWTPVDPTLTKARRITAGLVLLVPLIVGLVLLFISSVPKWIGLAVLAATVIGGAWLWWYIDRRTKAWRYAERDDDLLVLRGIMFKRLVIVPYGRMQLVDLAAGPIDRALGITTLQLHTAAATTDAVIPGLIPEVAAALRDRLAAKGEQRAAGL